MALFERDLLTFDFEGSGIRFLLVRGGRVVRWEALSVPPEQMSQGVVHDPAAVGGALRELLERNDVRKGRVVTSVTGLRAISRLMTLPPIKERLLEDALRHKIRQDTSLPLDDMDFSWHVLRRASDSLEVYALAVPREAIDRQVETLAVAGLRANAMDVKPLALARLVEAPSAIVLNVEDHSLSVLILRQWMPVVVRTVPFGVGRAAPEARLDLLLQELARTTKFYSEGHRDDPIDSQASLVATGELFENKDFLEALANRHSGPVQVPVPTLPHPDDLPAAMYSVNLGLAAKKV